MQTKKNRNRIKRVILDRLKIGVAEEHADPSEPRPPAAQEPVEALTQEEKIKAELEQLRKRIEDRKQIARDTDISHHLWGFYKSHFRFANPQSSDLYVQDGEWYDVNILRASAKNGLNTCEFELKGSRYKFVDDEENQGWCENTKSFSLSLYDESDRCLIEIPMKMKVDSEGRNYSIALDGPKAFLPGGWINDFINVKLKHQSMRNQEIRAQKHQERLSEIQELKIRFGIGD